MSFMYTKPALDEIDGRIDAGDLLSMDRREIQGCS
jgi:hypothetical protein